MPELDFAALREQLEGGARPPSFTEIRARRGRRTRRIAVVATAVATALAVTAGTLAAAGRPWSNPPEVHPTTPVAPTAVVSPTTVASPTDVPTTTPTTYAAPPQTPGLYWLANAGPVLFGLTSLCTANCDGGGVTPQYQYGLVRSGNFATSWSPVSTLPQPPGANPPYLLVADTSHMWAYADATVFNSADGGHTWHSSALGAYVNDNHHEIAAGVTGSVAWFSYGSSMWVATAGGPPAATLGSLPANLYVHYVRPVSASEVSVLAETPTSGSLWYHTLNGGRQWSIQPEPCAKMRFPGSFAETMAVAPDGSRWTVCASKPGAGSQPKDLVVSTDGGSTWVGRGQLESTGYGTDVYPFSSTMAWRTGGRADIYRTTDGVHWTDLVTTDMNGPMGFAAIDSQTAVYAYGAAYPSLRIFVTHDGGAHWTSHEFS